MDLKAIVMLRLNEQNLHQAMLWVHNIVFKHTYNNILSLIEGSNLFSDKTSRKNKYLSKTLFSNALGL